MARKQGQGKQTWTVCRKPGCDRKLRSDNRSGFCQNHHLAGGQCKRCLGPCRLYRDSCLACRIKSDKEKATKVGLCTAVGCTKIVHSLSGMCRKHWLVAGPECKARGCKTRTSLFTKTGYCSEHHCRAYGKRRAEQAKARRAAERAAKETA